MISVWIWLFQRWEIDVYKWLAVDKDCLINLYEWLTIECNWMGVDK